MTGHNADSGFKSWLVRKLHLAPKAPNLGLGALPYIPAVQEPLPQFNQGFDTRHAYSPPPDLSRLGPGMTAVPRPADAFCDLPPPLEIHPALRQNALGHRPLARAKSTPSLHRGPLPPVSGAPPAKPLPPLPPLPPVLPVAPPLPIVPQTVLDTTHVLVGLDEYDRLAEIERSAHRAETLRQLESARQNKPSQNMGRKAAPELVPPMAPYALKAKRSAPNLNRTALEYASAMLADLASRAIESTNVSSDSLPTFYLEEPGPTLVPGVYQPPSSNKHWDRVAR